jgi:CHASE3 domain sensor protein
MKPFDLSIGQRLAIGFGILLILLAGGFAYLVLAQEESSEAQARFAEQIAPRAELANELQRAIMYVGINARSFFLSPTDEALGRAQGSIADARESLQALAVAPMDAQDQELITTLRPLVDGYLQAVTRAIQAREATPVAPEQEQQLSLSREAAFTALQPLPAIAGTQTERRSRRYGGVAGASA